MYAYKYYQEELDGELDIFAVETNNARSDIPSGEITYGDVYKALPFDNYLCLVKIKGINIINYLSTYESSHFYITAENSFADASGINSYVKDSNSYYYLLIIDYIAISDYYSSILEIEKTYNNEDALPRNIFSRYLNGYPANAF